MNEIQACSAIGWPGAFAFTAFLVAVCYFIDTFARRGK